MELTSDSEFCAKLHKNSIIAEIFLKKFCNFAVDMGRVLCIDYGKRRCGIAVTDELRLTAGPLTTVSAADVMKFVLDYVSQNRVDIVLIGRPTTLLGEPSESWAFIKSFAAGLGRRLPPGVEIMFFDERFTSAIAHQAILKGGLKRKARRDKALVDRTAATIILTDFLESIYNK